MYSANTCKCGKPDAINVNTKTGEMICNDCRSSSLSSHPPKIACYLKTCKGFLSFGDICQCNRCGTEFDKPDLNPPVEAIESFEAIQESLQKFFSLYDTWPNSWLVLGSKINQIQTSLRRLI